MSDHVSPRQTNQLADIIRSAFYPAYLDESISRYRYDACTADQKKITKSNKGDKPMNASNDTCGTEDG